MLRAFLPFLVAASIAAAAEPDLTLFDRENIAAWCIVPYDAKKRGPEARAKMLKELGLTKLAYDWRAEHVPTFDAEVAAMKRHGIEITAWWYPGTKREILDTIRRTGIHPQLWVCGSRAIKAATEEERLAAEVERIRPIAHDAAALGCKVALYNHREPWFEEHEHQIAIIEQLRREGLSNVGIVFNFHHWRGSLAEFPALFKRIQPYLLAVNLNGMRADTTQYSGVRFIGTDESELQMMRVVAESGWRGPIGIINEHADMDAADALARNLAGIEWVVKEIREPGSGGPKPKEPAPAPASPRPAMRKPATSAVRDPREDYPAEYIIPAAGPNELTPANGWPAMQDYRTWTRSPGGPTSNRFSALTQINKSNVARLEPAWTYRSGDGKANIQCNPAIANGVMYVPTAGWNIAALDAATPRLPTGSARAPSPPRSLSRSPAAD